MSEKLTWQDVVRHKPPIKNAHSARFRMAITGPPSSGKTTIAKTIGREVRNTDDLLDRGWPEAIEAAADWFDDPEVEIIEGALVPHAVRRWMERNVQGQPVERAIYLGKSHEQLSEGQERFARGVRTIWESVKERLIERGVTVIDGGADDGV